MKKGVVGKKMDLKSHQTGVLLLEIPRFGDDRGDFTNIPFDIRNRVRMVFKRSYIIVNNQVGVVRAFHGHKKESKLFYVPKGAFKFIIMDMKTKEWKEYCLLASVSKILYVPNGYYNGFVSLSENSILMVFSTLKMEDSNKDDYRLPYDILGKEVWEINNR